MKKPYQINQDKWNRWSSIARTLDMMNVLKIIYTVLNHLLHFIEPNNAIKLNSQPLLRAIVRKQDNLENRIGGWQLTITLDNPIEYRLSLVCIQHPGTMSWLWYF